MRCFNIHFTTVAPSSVSGTEFDTAADVTAWELGDVSLFVLLGSGVESGSGFVFGNGSDVCDVDGDSVLDGMLATGESI